MALPELAGAGQRGPIRQCYNITLDSPRASRRLRGGALRFCALAFFALLMPETSDRTTDQEEAKAPALAGAGVP